MLAVHVFFILFLQDGRPAEAAKEYHPINQPWLEGMINIIPGSGIPNAQ